MKKLAAVLVCLATQPQAQSATEMTIQTCTALRDQVLSFVDFPSDNMGALAVEDGWCVVRDVKISPNDYISYVFSSIALRMDDAERLIADNLPPTAISLRINGIRTVPQAPGDPLFTYLYDVQSRYSGMDFAFDTNWDAATNVLTIADLSLDALRDNDVRVTAAFSGVDLSSQSAMESTVFGALLNTMTLDFTSNGFFETYLLYPLGPVLLSNTDDPEAEVVRLKAAFADLVGQAPAATLDPASAMALTELVNILPNPAGTLNMTLQSDVGLGAVRLTPVVMSGMPQSAEAFWPLLDGVAITAKWTPTAQ